VSDDTQWAGDAPREDQRPDTSAPAGVAEQPVPRTGSTAVDAVLESLDGLEDRPVGEHVAVFEAAHEQLRAALADAGDRAAG
jgi:hypothetical protein